jgi:hypothetical protein
MKQGTIAAVMAATAALALPGAAHAADYQDAVLADGPLSYWRLDEASGSVAQDATANDRDGTYSNATLGAAAPFITAGTAVTLPKTGSVAGTVGAPSGSVELWLNASKLKKGEQAGIAAHGDPAGDGWALGIGAKRKVAWKHAGATAQSRVTLPSAIWTQVTVTWDATKVRIYVNGNLTKTVNHAGGAPTSSSGAFVVGGNGAGAFTGALSGKVDEVALYQQVLSAQDIKEHFAAAYVPINTALPTITGTLAVGQTLTAHGGTWTNAGLATPSYQWQLCDGDAMDCDDIVGATGTTYLLADADQCGTLQVIETITNASGTGAAISDPTGVVGTGCGATDPGTGGGDPGTGTGGDPGTGTGGDPGTGTGGDPGTGTETGTGAGDGAGGDPTALPVACLRLQGKAARKLRRVGKLRIRVTAPGCVSASTPVKLKVKPRKGQAKPAKVKFRLDGKRVKVLKGKKLVARVKASRLAAGKHRLVVKVVAANGTIRKFKLRLTLA